MWQYDGEQVARKTDISRPHFHNSPDNGNSQRSKADLTPFPCQNVGWRDETPLHFAARIFILNTDKGKCSVNLDDSFHDDGLAHDNNWPQNANWFKNQNYREIDPAKYLFRKGGGIVLNPNYIEK